MTTSYPTERKRMKKWYKKHFIHLINISSFNSHIIHKKKEGKLDALNFCIILIKQIVEKYRTEVKSSVERQGGRPSLEGNPFRLTERHFLILITPTNKKDKPTRYIVTNMDSERKVDIYVDNVRNHFA